MTRASVVIPVHDKPTTLPLTVDTVLRQSVGDLEVIVVGDGVTDAVRSVVDDLVARDERVRFLDFPKGPHHGERYRHDAVRAARSDAIFYLCDDDLLLPDHVADLLALLQDAGLVQSYNGFLRPDGRVGFYPADLADPGHVRLMLDDRIRHNAVSITGTAHSRAFYDRVGERWDTTPAGEWPDHHQWRKLMRHPDFRGATSHRMTALQLPTSANGRVGWSPEQRLAELERWHAVVTGPDAQARIDALVLPAALGELARTTRRAVELQIANDGYAEARAELARTRFRVRRLEERLRLKNARLEKLRTRLRSRDQG
ncbi:glycosyltransferase family 2 protein [Nocardioides sp. SYSU D00038]|uniref:glycosyltransferase family 2 protein n=1 Tax=Nocardioides sp. SYSU D00038 TaxID=2812554 RepID=UPI00196861AB|nr:glycosyltransferase family 2 protein [Nocardioides sp. SYSU D00038]